MDTFKDDRDESLRSNTTVFPSIISSEGFTGRRVPDLAISIDTKLGWNFSDSYFELQSLTLSLESLET